MRCERTEQVETRSKRRRTWHRFVPGLMSACFPATAGRGFQTLAWKLRPAAPSGGSKAEQQSNEAPPREKVEIRNRDGVQGLQRDPHRWSSALQKEPHRWSPAPLVLVLRVPILSFVKIKGALGTLGLRLCGCHGNEKEPGVCCVIHYSAAVDHASIKDTIPTLVSGIKDALFMLASKTHSPC